MPSHVIHGLVVALHIKLSHPSANELNQIIERQFFALNLRDIVTESTKRCHTCSSLASVPKALCPQMTSDPPQSINQYFAADVIRRERQFILVLREYVSSLTQAMLIENERHTTLQKSILSLLLNHLSINNSNVTVRVDPAPGFQALINDPLLQQHGISLEIGRHRNANKNPVADRAIQEVEEAIQRLEQHAEPINSYTLAVVINRVNSKLRSNGLSTREMVILRNQYTNEHIDLSDTQLLMNKHQAASQNNVHYAKSKASLPR